MHFCSCDFHRSCSSWKTIQRLKALLTPHCEERRCLAAVRGKRKERINDDDDDESTGDFENLRVKDNYLDTN